MYDNVHWPILWSLLGVERLADYQLINRVLPLNYSTYQPGGDHDSTASRANSMKVLFCGYLGQGEIHRAIMMSLYAFLAILAFLTPVRSSRPTESTETVLVTKELPVQDFSTVSIDGNRAGNMMPSVGNGYLGTVIFSDSVHVSGLYNGKAFSKGYPVYPINSTQHTHRARVPSTCAINFKVLNISGSTSYGLNITRGVFYKWFHADLGANGTLDIEQRFYAHRQKKRLMVVEMTVKNYLDRNITINMTNNFGKYSRDIGFTQYTVDEKVDLEMAFGEIKTAEEVDSLKSKVAIAFTNIPEQIEVASSDWRTWYYITAAATSVDTRFDPWRQAEGAWKEASRRQRYLLWHHKKAWEEIWNSGKIDIEGNLHLSQAVYGSMYYILSSIRSDWPYGLSPGGLSGGEEYMGHTFWDQDIWMYPFLVLLYPDLARSCLQYRYERLPAARRIARNHGYRGAMFPWESSLTGLETSPGANYGTFQVHITGDIAYAAKLYWWATKDLQWLRRVGFHLAYQTAEFWASRVRYDKKKDRYNINYVMPPDEYHFPVDNSVYTNVIAKQNLEFATECGKILNRYVPGRWKRIAAKMYIPFDDNLNYHPEFDDFNLRSMKTKQADAILLGYPLMYNMSRQVRYNDLLFYENVTDVEGPAMTHPMTAIGWLELGEKQRADAAFLKNYDNLNGPFKVWTERIDRKGAVNFITGAGGFLQAVLYGYGGFRLTEKHLEFNPYLTPSSKKLTITGVDYLGNSLKFAIKQKRVGITLTSRQEVAPTLEVVLFDKVHKLKLDTPISVPRGKGIVRMRE